MTIQNILDSIYIIPVILDHLEEPTVTTRKILKENQISDATLVQCDAMRHLLMYHREIIANNYQPNYDLLRTGLKEYFDTNLSDVFYQLHLAEPMHVLDYGAGDGRMARKFQEDYPNSTVLTMDRKDSDINVDFEQEPHWFKSYINTFDVVILSEVLHCKQQVVRHYVIDSIHEMLHRGGHLVIIENEDYCMEYRISKIKQGDFSVLSDKTVKALCSDGFKLNTELKINKHTIYDFIKI